ncbi:helix-turn-helix domain-containing protein [Mucilaginibacter sp.]|uniref:helix-turn-helix domain-containing protein n=1 Tax=Mucilaginibacter sp. TaxID=1882438 RepID=UPI003B008601
MPKSNLVTIKTISEYHQIMGHQRQLHPLVSVINLETVHRIPFDKSVKLVYDFYCIALKKNTSLKFNYGQQDYDFNTGTLFFMAPKQVFSFGDNYDTEEKPTGWALLFHPDFLWNTALATAIKKFDFFDYSVNEALHLSDREEATISNIVGMIEQEYESNIDNFSQEIIATQIMSLLNYAERFFQRQFITRKKTNHQVLVQLEQLFATYFDAKEPLSKGMLTVQNVAENLNISPNYLSRLLTTLTGKSTKQFIQDKIIEKAKEQLSTSNLSISEIAYTVGFDFPQSFNKLFKSKTKQTPQEFRASFN